MPDLKAGFLSGAALLLDPEAVALWGPAGSLRIPAQDRITRKLAMLYEGECSGLGVARTAAKYGYSRQGYYRLLKQFRNFGAAGFLQRPGPKRNYRRGEEVVRAVVRLGFQDPDRSAPELVGALHEAGFRVSARSVERIISDYGLHRRDHPKGRARSEPGPVAARRPTVPTARLPACNPERMPGHVPLDPGVSSWSGACGGPGERDADRRGAGIRPPGAARRDVSYDRCGGVAVPGAEDPARQP